MDPRSDVLVVGGGVVGVACVLELARRGVGATLVERGEVGRGCSYGNAGWLTPSLATPLPAPGMLYQGLKWMRDPESPFRIRPAASLELARWLVRFGSRMRRSCFERGTEALAALSRESLEAYDALSRSLPDDFGFERRGLLMLGLTERGVDAARHELDLATRHGMHGVFMTADETRAFEPAIAGTIRGAVHFTADAHCEPLAVVRAMAKEAERLGARIVEGCEVFGFDVDGARIRRLRTTGGEMEAERYVLAAGVWSKPLARDLGVRIPLMGGKGYAVVVSPLGRMPRVPIKVTEHRIAITPRRDSLRLAGTLEVVDTDEAIDPRRVDAIVRRSRDVLDLPERPDVLEIWRGLRPCTPDGLPVIGFAPRLGNLMLATGHQMCGLHTAPATARLAADLLLGETPSHDPAPFRADRF